MSQCLKCGKETAGKAVFCSECQDIMHRHPIKPGTVVHLPQRQNRAEKKTQVYGASKQAQQLAKLRGAVRFLLVLVALLSVLLTATAVMLIRTLDKETPTVPIGRNYTTVDTSG